MAFSNKARLYRSTGKSEVDPPLFSQSDYELRIIDEKVCLEFVQIDTEEIHGVLNTTYDKDVTVHYT